MTTPALIYSILGNPKSLVPLGVKDGANCLGLTTSSYVTGKKEEAQDRFIDEVGTEVIWLGGIPLFKKLIDKTIFKLFKFDSKCDIRNLENPKIFKKSIEKAPQKLKDGMKYIGENAKSYKALNIVKVIASIGLALGTYNILTDLKQKYTEKKLEEKIKKQMDKENQNAFNQSKTFVKAKNNKNYITFSSIKKYNNNLSFKGGVSNFILDPVKNMYILDGGITTERLAKSRDPQEFAGYAIREGGFLFFMYILGQKIQDYMENRSDTKFNKSIALDARVLEDDKFKELFKNGKIEQSLDAFPEYTTQPEKKFFQKVKDFFNPPKKTDAEMIKDAELYDYIHENPENAIIKAAKKSDLIENYKYRQKGILGFFKKKIDSGMIDTRKYIDLDEIRKTHGNIKKLYEQFKLSGEDIDTFFNGVRKHKRNSIRTNIGSSILALGVILPGVMLAKRLLSNDKEFATEKRVRERLHNEKNRTNQIQ